MGHTGDARAYFVFNVDGRRGCSLDFFARISPNKARKALGKGVTFVAVVVVDRLRALGRLLDGRWARIAVFLVEQIATCSYSCFIQCWWHDSVI